MSRELVYLHGFASSARSSKAAYLAARAADAGMRFQAPDLNGPDFATLTITRMVEEARHRLAAREPGPVTLIGSSLGAVVAVFVAALEHARGAHAIDTMVLMAPAVDLVPGLTQHFGVERLREWERTNRLEVFHHAEQRMRALEWGFFADAQRYDAWSVELPVPALVFQGLRDETVDARTVERWAAGRPNVTLSLVDDGHQLLNSLDAMWEGVRRFLPEAGVDGSALRGASPGGM